MDVYNGTSDLISEIIGDRLDQPMPSLPRPGLFCQPHSPQSSPPASQPPTDFDIMHEIMRGHQVEQPVSSLPGPPPLDHIQRCSPVSQQLTGGSLSNIEFILKIIREHGEQPVSSLPGPPSPPPLGHLCQSQSPNNHNPPRENSAVSQQPVLVARGTACPAAYNFVQPVQPLSGSREMMSTPPSSSSLASKSCSGESSFQNAPGTELLERVLERPTLVIVEEPKDRGMRFRYECEGRSAGSILGASSTDSNKTQPAIEIQGPIDHIKKVKITASLVTKDFPHRPHPHCLVGKDCPNNSGICVVALNPHVSRRHSFANLGIQCVRRKELEASLQKRRNQNIDPFQTGHSKGIEDIDMNAVRLCFQCELEWEDGKKDCLKPIMSKPIYDKKATTTSQLKISRLNIERGSCTGKTEVYMLCDKVQKDDIEIIFRRDSWKANGEFAQTDVHRQVGIVFKTPPYQDQNITEEVEVSLSLRRISDQMESEPVTFTYLPRNPDPYEVNRKRKIKSDRNFTEGTCTTEKSAPASGLQFHRSPSQPRPSQSADELLRVPLPGAFQGDVCYMEPQSSNMASEEDATLINQLLEIPEFVDLLSDPNFPSLSAGFEQGPDASASLANMDLTFNQNTASYIQDFTHYNDLQFNMLVNENQNVSSEVLDSSFPMVQVKTEEEL